MEEHRVKNILICLFIGVMTLVTAISVTVQYRRFQYPKDTQLSRYSRLEKSKYKFNIEKMQKHNAAYDEVSGWVTVPGIANRTYDTKLVLYRKDTDRALEFPTTMVNRSDVTSDIHDGLDHNSSGFQVMIPQKYLNSHYRIAFLMRVGNSERLLLTGKKYKIMDRGND